jgi:hypothetical protein
MNLKDILAIAGKGGLFKYVSQGRNGIIVESFEDKKRTVVHTSAKVSALEDIAIFTKTEELPLEQVFEKLYKLKEGQPAISHKSSPDELKALMEEVLPEYDRERVYVSDMKKLVHWYNLLLGLGLLIPGEKAEEKEKAKVPKSTSKSTDKASKVKSEPKSKSKGQAAKKTVQPKTPRAENKAK